MNNAVVPAIKLTSSTSVSPFSARRTLTSIPPSHSLRNAVQHYVLRNRLSFFYLAEGTSSLPQVWRNTWWVIFCLLFMACFFGAESGGVGARFQSISHSSLAGILSATLSSCICALVTIMGNSFYMLSLRSATVGFYLPFIAIIVYLIVLQQFIHKGGVFAKLMSYLVPLMIYVSFVEIRLSSWIIYHFFASVRPSFVDFAPINTIGAFSLVHSVLALCGLVLGCWFFVRMNSVFNYQHETPSAPDIIKPLGIDTTPRTATTRNNSEKATSSKHQASRTSSMGEQFITGDGLYGGVFTSDCTGQIHPLCSNLTSWILVYRAILSGMGLPALSWGIIPDVIVLSFFLVCNPFYRIGQRRIYISVGYYLYMHIMPSITLLLSTFIQFVYSPLSQGQFSFIDSSRLDHRCQVQHFLRTQTLKALYGFDDSPVPGDFNALAMRASQPLIQGRGATYQEVIEDSLAALTGKSPCNTLHSIGVFSFISAVILTLFFIFIIFQCYKLVRRRARSSVSALLGCLFSVAPFLLGELRSLRYQRLQGQRPSRLAVHNDVAQTNFDTSASHTQSSLQMNFDIHFDVASRSSRYTEPTTRRMRQRQLSSRSARQSLRVPTGQQDYFAPPNLQMYTLADNDEMLQRILRAAQRVSSDSMVDQNRLLGLLMMFDMCPTSYEFSALVALTQVIVLTNPRFKELLTYPYFLDFGSRSAHYIIRQLCLAVALTLPGAKQALGVPKAERPDTETLLLDQNGQSESRPMQTLDVTTAVFSGRVVTGTQSIGGRHVLPLFHRAFVTASMLLSSEGILRHRIHKDMTVGRIPILARYSYYNLYEPTDGLQLNLFPFVHFMGSAVGHVFSETDIVRKRVTRLTWFNVVAGADCCGPPGFFRYALTSIFLVLTSPLLAIYAMRRDRLHRAYVVAAVDTARLLGEAALYAVGESGGFDNCIVYTPPSQYAPQLEKDAVPPLQIETTRRADKCRPGYCQCGMARCPSRFVHPQLGIPSVGGFELPASRNIPDNAVLSRLYGRKQASIWASLMPVVEEPSIQHHQNYSLQFSWQAQWLLSHMAILPSPRLASWALQCGVRELRPRRFRFVPLELLVSALGFRFLDVLTDVHMAVSLDDFRAASRCCHRMSGQQTYSPFRDMDTAWVPEFSVSMPSVVYPVVDPFMSSVSLTYAAVCPAHTKMAPEFSSSHHWSHALWRPPLKQPPGDISAIGLTTDNTNSFIHSLTETGAIMLTVLQGQFQQFTRIAMLSRRIELERMTFRPIIGVGDLQERRTSRAPTLRRTPRLQQTSSADSVVFPLLIGFQGNDVVTTSSSSEGTMSARGPPQMNSAPRFVSVLSQNSPSFQFGPMYGRPLGGIGQKREDMQDLARSVFVSVALSPSQLKQVAKRVVRDSVEYGDELQCLNGRLLSLHDITHPVGVPPIIPSIYQLCTEVLVASPLMSEQLSTEDEDQIERSVSWLQLMTTEAPLSLQTRRSPVYAATMTAPNMFIRRLRMAVFVSLLIFIAFLSFLFPILRAVTPSGSVMPGSLPSSIILGDATDVFQQGAMMVEDAEYDALYARIQDASANMRNALMSVSKSMEDTSSFPFLQRVYLPRLNHLNNSLTLQQVMYTELASEAGKEECLQRTGYYQNHISHDSLSVRDFSVSVSSLSSSMNKIMFIERLAVSDTPTVAPNNWAAWHHQVSTSLVQALDIVEWIAYAGNLTVMKRILTISIITGVAATAILAVSLILLCVLRSQTHHSRSLTFQVNTQIILSQAIIHSVGLAQSHLPLSIPQININSMWNPGQFFTAEAPEDTGLGQSGATLQEIELRPPADSRQGSFCSSFTESDTGLLPPRPSSLAFQQRPSQVMYDATNVGVEGSQNATDFGFDSDLEFSESIVGPRQEKSAVSKAHTVMVALLSILLISALLIVLIPSSYVPNDLVASFSLHSKEEGHSRGEPPFDNGVRGLVDTRSLVTGNLHALHSAMAMLLSVTKMEASLMPLIGMLMRYDGLRDDTLVSERERYTQLDTQFYEQFRGVKGSVLDLMRSINSAASPFITTRVDSAGAGLMTTASLTTDFIQYILRYNIIVATQDRGGQGHWERLDRELITELSYAFSPNEYFQVTQGTTPVQHGGTGSAMFRTMKKEGMDVTVDGESILDFIAPVLTDSQLDAWRAEVEPEKARYLVMNTMTTNAITNLRQDTASYLSYYGQTMATMLRQIAKGLDGFVYTGKTSSSLTVTYRFAAAGVLVILVWIISRFLNLHFFHRMTQGSLIVFLAEIALVISGDVLLNGMKSQLQQVLYQVAAYESSFPAIYSIKQLMLVAPYHVAPDSPDSALDQAVRLTERGLASVAGLRIITASDDELLESLPGSHVARQYVEVFDKEMDAAISSLQDELDLSWCVYSELYRTRNWENQQNLTHYHVASDHCDELMTGAGFASNWRTDILNVVTSDQWSSFVIDHADSDDSWHLLADYMDDVYVVMARRAEICHRLRGFSAIAAYVTLTTLIIMLLCSLTFLRGYIPPSDLLYTDTFRMLSRAKSKRYNAVAQRAQGPTELVPTQGPEGDRALPSFGDVLCTLSAALSAPLVWLRSSRKSLLLDVCDPSATTDVFGDAVISPVYRTKVPRILIFMGLGAASSEMSLALHVLGGTVRCLPYTTTQPPAPRPRPSQPTWAWELLLGSAVRKGLLCGSRTRPQTSVRHVRPTAAQILISLFCVLCLALILIQIISFAGSEIGIVFALRPMRKVAHLIEGIFAGIASHGITPVVAPFKQLEEVDLLPQYMADVVAQMDELTSSRVFNFVNSNDLILWERLLGVVHTWPERVDQLVTDVASVLSALNTHRKTLLSQDPLPSGYGSFDNALLLNLRNLPTMASYYETHNDLMAEMTMLSSLLSSAVYTMFNSYNVLVVQILPFFCAIVIALLFLLKRNYHLDDRWTLSVLS